MLSEVLRLKGPEQWHHDYETVDVVKRESLMRTIKCLKKPKIMDFSVLYYNVWRAGY